MTRLGSPTSTAPAPIRRGSRAAVVAVALVLVLAAACADDDSGAGGSDRAAGDTGASDTGASDTGSTDDGSTAAAGGGAQGDRRPADRSDRSGFYDAAADLCRDHQAVVAQMEVPTDAGTIRAALRTVLDLTDRWRSDAEDLVPPREVAELWATTLARAGTASDAMRALVDGPILDPLPDDAPLDEVFAALEAEPTAGAIEADLADALRTVNDVLDRDCFDVGFG